MNDQVRVLIADDVDYEDLIAEIQVDGDCIAILSQEQDDIVVEFDHEWVWSKKRHGVPLLELKRALEQAEESLRRMKKR